MIEPKVSLRREYSFIYPRPRNMGWPTIISRRYNGDLQEIAATKIRVCIIRKDGEMPPVVARVSLVGKWGTGRVIDAWMGMNHRKGDHYYATDAPDWVMELVADALLRASEDDG